jgi:CRP-like cAMP-binding protein
LVIDVRSEREFHAKAIEKAANLPLPKLAQRIDRISHYIESAGLNGEVNLTQTKKAWAEELGLSHAALYRALRRMQDDNLLSVKGDRFISNSILNS